MPYCEKCGKKNDDDANYCTKCANYIGKDNSLEKNLDKFADKIERTAEEFGEFVGKTVGEFGMVVDRTLNPKLKKCKNCGNESVSDATYCWKCGKKI
jgi:uncharacterized membrane protein YvbJ